MNLAREIRGKLQPQQKYQLNDFVHCIISPEMEVCPLNLQTVFSITHPD
ncbi:MAG: hypothetical protein IBX60_03050 [Candidatus Aminicenantes bacterium]|nr:hypothetical protein [Candidatus Aminicenantes bacterium]